MKQKHILKWLGIALGVYLLYGVLTAILVPLPQKEATGKLWSQYEARLSTDASQERVRSIEDTDSALLWRLQLIESAEREVIFSTFDLRADGSGQDLMAALYGAASVEAVDVSEEALALVRRNAELNGVADRVTTTCANVFDLARQYAAEGRQYGLVICDPPAFAKSRKVLESAYRGYKELNLQCMKLVRPGGFLVSCSCSQFMTPELFLKMLREAAQDAGRDARLLEPLIQSRDHPASLASEQSLYLKGDILQIL